MNLLDTLKRGRSQAILVGGVFVTVSGVLVREDSMAGSLNNPPVPRPAPRIEARIAAIEPMRLAPHRALTEREMEYARIAWRYFENNTNSKTLLVNAANKYPSTTMWDTASYLVGLIAAHKLAIIDDAEFHRRLSGAFQSLKTMELFEGRLPNKAYNVRTLKMSTYANKPDKRGLGWSALDIGHLLAPLAYLKLAHPEHAPDIAAIIDRWDLEALVQNGELIGSAVRKETGKGKSKSRGKTIFLQEGRVGYEQYGAKAMILFGLDASKAADAYRHLTLQTVGGIDIPVDDRHLGNGSASFATSEPYVLRGLDFGFDTTSLRLASNVYRAQEQRYRDTGQFTAVSEGHISVKPYFTYSTVWGDGDPWAVMRLDGSRMDDLRTISTKAAFGWHALFETEYTTKLIASLEDLAQPEKGWKEGRYEFDGSPNSSTTCNNNAIILASLAYRQFGPLLQHDKGA
ncbi:DUF3131 domain-containing protein [Jiella mangrovi]|uniref:DUF3131 domain-containing protein n=1 Tax=Jiella mangrovi TaxID=2821407 RepID=A0ABS4BCG8_9HYPH|nr:DUF3131 domain-containing protein [Jiella mangrovi]MBP0614443.1 DUF3131 domain-containing protein [Jiella mangrovi]